MRVHFAVGLALVGLAGCDDLLGLDQGAPTPLARVQVRVLGDPATVRSPGAPPSQLHVGIRWLTPFLVDSACVPPAYDAAHAAIIEQGCGDQLRIEPSFDLVPGFPVDPDGNATIDLYTTPSVLFGDRYSQIAYATIVAFDVAEQNDAQYSYPFSGDAFAGSFLSMTAPDVRLAFRHGGFDDQLAYYPRRGCPPPPEGYSLVSAGGFTMQAAIEAQTVGELPAQNAADCRSDTLDRPVELTLRPPDELQALSCGHTLEYFSQPPRFVLPDNPDDPDDEPTPDPDDDDPFPDSLKACIPMPARWPGAAEHPDKRQAVVALASNGTCDGAVYHFILRGCYADPFCAVPDWDVPAPSWWPCPTTGEP